MTSSLLHADDPAAERTANLDHRVSNLGCRHRSGADGEGGPSLATGRFRDPGIVAQAPSSNQQRVKILRARYRDCPSREEIPPFACKAV